MKDKSIVPKQSCQFSIQNNLVMTIATHKRILYSLKKNVLKLCFFLQEKREPAVGISL